MTREEMWLAMDAIIERMKHAIDTRFTRDASRCPSLKEMADFINERLGYNVRIEPGYCNTDRKCGRLRIPGRGRHGNRLIVSMFGQVLLDHNSAETYRHNTEVARWIMGQLDKNQITVELILPSLVAGAPYKARAICQARLTKTQIIVESGEVVHTRTRGQVVLGDLPYRFNRQTGRRIPYIRGAWQLRTGTAMPEISRTPKPKS